MKWIYFLCLFAILILSIFIHEGVHVAQRHGEIEEVCLLGYMPLDTGFNAIGWVTYYGETMPYAELQAYLVQGCTLLGMIVYTKRKFEVL